MRTVEDIVSEATAVVDAARKGNIVLRVLGGVGVFMHSPSAASVAGLRRQYGDVDFCGLGRQAPDIARLALSLGYEPNRRFNALHGRQRLMFVDPRTGCHVDIFLDRCHMCHDIDLRKRLHLDPPTLTPADLMLTKLQIVQLNKKDIQDVAALLLDHALGPGPDEIDGSYVAGVCSVDWGLHHTVSKNVQAIIGWLGDLGLDCLQASTVEERVAALLKLLADTPKTLKWKARATIGERLPWYELPEDPTRGDRREQG